MGKVGKKHVEGRTREQRKAVRKKLGPLRELTVQTRTKDRYAHARQGFYSYLRQNQLTVFAQEARRSGSVSFRLH